MQQLGMVNQSAIKENLDRLVDVAKSVTNGWMLRRRMLS